MSADSIGFGAGGGINFEVYRDGEGWHWNAYHEDVFVAVGIARTRLGLARSIRRAHRRLAGEA